MNDIDNDVNIECTVTATNDEMANGIFKLATQRLLNVNTWNNLDGSLLADCQLTDARGFKVDRDVLTNDYLQIHEASDHSPESSKWIKIEKVEEFRSSNNRESIVLETRSTVNPLTDSNATVVKSYPGMISIVREGLNITARVCAKGLDETGSDKVVDKMMNISKVAYISLGAYCVQWRSLVNGILGDLGEVDQFLF